MKVRAIDEGHDWKFGFNQSDYKEFSEAVKQNVLTAILTVRGDWFLALEVGIDWVNYLGRSSNLQLLEADLKSSVLNVDGVLRIDNISIELEREKRKATTAGSDNIISNPKALLQGFILTQCQNRTAIQIPCHP